jgi:hypothetical protein
MAPKINLLHSSNMFIHVIPLPLQKGYKQTCVRCNPCMSASVTSTRAVYGSHETEENNMWQKLTEELTPLA